MCKSSYCMLILYLCIIEGWHCFNGALLSLCPLLQSCLIAPLHLADTSLCSLLPSYGASLSCNLETRLSPETSRTSLIPSLPGAHSPHSSQVPGALSCVSHSSPPLVCVSCSSLPSCVCFLLVFPIRFSHSSLPLVCVSLVSPTRVCFTRLSHSCVPLVSTTRVWPTRLPPLVPFARQITRSVVPPLMFALTLLRVFILW